jgi:enoyl-[acyl-carrier protein] reductase I
MLADKRLIITGIVTTDSIAFGVAERAQLMGAEVLLTAFPRDRSLTEAAAAALPRAAEILDLDVTQRGDLDQLTERLRRSWGRVDGALHAVAFAPRDALAGDFLEARPEGVNTAFQTSAFSYASLGRVLAQLAPPEGGSLVGLDFDAAGAWPVYNWMGVCKAALESVNRYLARDLGARGIRANLVAAGPLHTRAAGGIPAFERLLEAWETQAPMRWDARDPGPVADAVCFLLSDLGRAITGEILHVDGGYHAMAGALRAAAGVEVAS